MQKLKELLEIGCKLQNDIGAPHTTHSMIAPNYAMLSNGVVSYGSPIESYITCYPHTQTFHKAIKVVGEDLSKIQFVLMDNETLLLRSGRTRIKVPCISPDKLTPVSPDNPLVQVVEGFFEGLAKIGIVVAENTDLVLTSSIALFSGFAVATTRHVYAEYWHGVELPAMIVPKQFITLLGKIKKKPVGLGYSTSSLTVHYDDASWLKTNLFNLQEYPDVTPVRNNIYAIQNNWQIKPTDFDDAIKTVQQFCETGVVTLENSVIAPTEGKKSASYDFDSLPGHGRFKIADLALMSELGEYIDLVGDAKAVYFAANNIRGAIARMVD